MPLIQGEVAVNNGATVDNALSGSSFEFLPYDCYLEIGLSAPTAATVGDIIADVFSGSDILATNMKVPNFGPIKMNEAMYLDDEALAGERLVIRLRNTSATSRNVQFLVKLTPLGA